MECKVGRVGCLDIGCRSFGIQNIEEQVAMLDTDHDAHIASAVRDNGSAKFVVENVVSRQQQAMQSAWGFLSIIFRRLLQAWQHKSPKPYNDARISFIGVP